MANYAYQNLVTPQNTGSGVSDYVLVAPVSWFAVDGIKCPEAPFSAPGDEVTTKASFEFLAEKGFIKYALAPEKNQLEAKTIGDKGFNKFDFVATIFVPGSYSEVHEAVKNFMNIPLIALLKDSNCGANFYYQLGCDCTFAYMSPSFSTGTTKDGVKGYNIEITWQNDFIQIHQPTTGVVDLLADLS